MTTTATTGTNNINIKTTETHMIAVRKSDCQCDCQTIRFYAQFRRRRIGSSVVVFFSGLFHSSVNTFKNKESNGIAFNVLLFIYWSNENWYETRGFVSVCVYWRSIKRVSIFGSRHILIGKFSEPNDWMTGQKCDRQGNADSFSLNKHANRSV